MNVSRLRKRAAEIQSELKQKSADLESGAITAAEFKALVPKLVEEGEEIKSQLDLHKKATQYGAAADAALGWSDGVGSIHSAQPGPGELLRPVSPYDMTPDQLEQLIQAAKSRTPLRVEIAPKRYSDPVALKSMPSKWQPIFKTAVSESSITSAFSSANFPPLQSPHAIGKAYEPSRTASWFPAYAWNKQALSWLTHTSNASASSAVAELGTKTDIGEEYGETTVTSTLIAGLASVSLQGLWDSEGYGEANLAAFIPFELQRDLIQTESNALLNAVSGTDNYTFSGLLQTSGTLTRSYTDSLTPLDTIAAGINDMRISSGAYSFPDLAICSPSTLLTLRTQKDSTGRYIWDML
jgi:Phage capsid family